MDIDYSPYFDKYESIVVMCDTVFDKIKTAFSDCVTCSKGCSDCCYALFDVTLIEGIYLNHHFNERFSGKERDELLELANQYDRKVHKIKRKAFREVQQGADEGKVLVDVGNERLRCPLLDENDQCRIYDKRPVTCRLYGIPTAMGGRSHTCGLSAFKPGESYPTVNYGTILANLQEISHSLARDIGSRFTGLGEILVPLSMALLTVYDEEYLGLLDPKTGKESE